MCTSYDQARLRLIAPAGVESEIYNNKKVLSLRRINDGRNVLLEFRQFGMPL